MNEETPGAPPRFEDALRRLEQLVQELESGALPLEDSIARFEEGQELLRICSAQLERAEMRVQEVIQKAGGALAARELVIEEGPDV